MRSLRKRPHRASFLRSRKGAALFIVMMFVVAIAVMAITAIITTGNASLVAKSYARENDLRYAAEAALAIGKSRLNFDASALPESGYVTLMADQSLISADNNTIEGVKVTVYAGPSGSTSGQFGRFASVVAEARDNQGNGFIRRLELAQESFAKYAYWSNQEKTAGGSTIVFASGDQLWGPVWSNDVITIASPDPIGAIFNDDVGTAKTISGKSNGTFKKTVSENQKAIALPPTTAIEASLAAFATSGGFKFTAAQTGAASGTRLRVEFVAIDLNLDGDSTDADEGFFKVYEANSGNAWWLRGDFPNDYDNDPAPNNSQAHMCGDWHKVSVAAGATDKFFPASIHDNTWARDLWVAGGMAGATATTHRTESFGTIMGNPGARCFLGGVPQLVATARNSASFTTAQKRKGGEDSTHTFTDQYGAWKKFTDTPNALVTLRRPIDAKYLFPIHRTLNPGAKGVIHVTGNAGVSGTLRGKVTLYATGNIVILDDMRYTVDPASGLCLDMLGLLSNDNIIVAYNALLSPQKTRTSGTIAKNVDDTKDLYLHGVMMALNTSFTVERYDDGPSNLNDCAGQDNGRGCLYLSGGLIQSIRGAVGLVSGRGFLKRYSYDRCAVVNPPPYFPTTGKFVDSRYYELNPVGFNAGGLYKSITPGEP